VVHASTTPEPLGLVVLEGMVLGKPVIASRLGGPAEVVQQGSGLLFDPAHPEGLAALFETLAADPERRRDLGEAGQRRAEEFSIGRNVRAIEAVYRELLRLGGPELRG
jgi:glycosyltransferase involved in cell wall biosynthesis